MVLKFQEAEGKSYIIARLNVIISGNCGSLHRIFGNRVWKERKLGSTSFGRRPKF